MTSARPGATRAARRRRSRRGLPTTSLDATAPTPGLGRWALPGLLLVPFALKRLVLSQTYARIRVLIADPTRAIKAGNNFVHLGRRLNTYIEFRHVREDLRTHAESFCIADETALVYRLQASRWEGIADTYEPAVAKLYSKMFDEIWLASEVEMEFRQLGI